MYSIHQLILEIFCQCISSRISRHKKRGKKEGNNTKKKDIIKLKKIQLPKHKMQEKMTRWIHKLHFGMELLSSDPMTKRKLHLNIHAQPLSSERT